MKERVMTWTAKLESIVLRYQKLDAACDAALAAGAMNSEGPLYDAIWRAWGGMIDLVDKHGWINWYIYENDCGAKKMEARGCGQKKLQPIKNTRQLARLIILSEDA